MAGWTDCGKGRHGGQDSGASDALTLPIPTPDSPFGPGRALTPCSAMPSLVDLLAEKQFDQAHAMLDRGEGDVNEGGRVRSTLSIRTRRDATSAPLHLCPR